MKVKELKELINKFPDEHYVYIIYDGLILDTEGRELLSYYGEDNDIDNGLIVSEQQLKTEG